MKHRCTVQFVHVWRFLVSRWTLRCLLILSQLDGPLEAQAQSAPQLVSVTPADGSIDVATNSTIVFVFNQDMNVRVLPNPGAPPTLIGNFEIDPANTAFSGSWGRDLRTLTFKTSREMPYGANISWTLNPTNQNVLLPLTSAAGQPLATVSGSFRTAAYVPPPPIPKLVSVTPTNRATEIGQLSPLVFVFDQDMDTNRPLKAADFPSVTGNYQFLPASLNTQFNGGMWEDKRTLSFKPLAPFDFNVSVGWVLNQIGTTVSPIQSAAGQALDVISGGYQTISDTGGNFRESCVTTNSTGPTYVLTRGLAYQQTAANQIIPDTPGGLFELHASSPGVKGRNVTGEVTNSVVTFPDGRTVTLVEITNVFSFSDLASSSSALDAAYPAGSYTWEFDQVGETNHAPVIDVPSQDGAAIPMIANFAEAQQIDPTQSFTLQWNAFSQTNAGAFINLVITDTSGKLIYKAPNACVRRTLAPTDTSAVIPANYLRAGLNYNGTLQFGNTFYSSLTDVPALTGRAVEQQTTRFNLGTLGSQPISGGTGTNTVAMRARFTAFQVLPIDPSTHLASLQLNLTGSPGQTYQILRSSTLINPNWGTVGPVTMNADGTGVIKVPFTVGRTTTSALFYSALNP